MGSKNMTLIELNNDVQHRIDMQMTYDSTRRFFNGAPAFTTYLQPYSLPNTIVRLSKQNLERTT